MNSADVVKAPPGLGKTSLVVQRVAALMAGTTCEIYVPTHALAAEVKNALLNANPRLSVKVIAGRSHHGSGGQPMCMKYKVAELVAKAGAEVYSSLCARKKKDKIEYCSHYAKCQYIKQFTPSAVMIYTHAHLPLPRSRLESGVPDIAIIDESFFQSCIEIIEVPMGLLRAPFLSARGTQVCGTIEHALQRRLPLLTHLRDNGMDGQELRKVEQEIARGRPMISPRMKQSAQRAGLRDLTQRTWLRKLLDTLYRERYAHRCGSHGVAFDASTQKVTVHIKKHVHRFQDPLRKGVSSSLRKESRTLIIDGSADECIISEFFEVRSFTRIQASRQATVVQCRSVRCSTTSLAPKRNKDPKNRRAAKKRLTEVEAFIGRLATQHSKVLVVGPQAISGNPKAGVKPLLNVPTNVDLAHFNAIRGIDQWHAHDAVVVVGRNEPPIKAVEAIARCIYLTRQDPLFFADAWSTAQRGYRIKRKLIGVDVVVHPDPYVQGVLEQQREAESMQAIDRIRLVHGAAPKDVYILSNIPLDIDVDQLVSWEEMVEGSRVERAWDACPGVLPLAPAWLAAKFSQLWKSPDAAKADVARELKKCQIANTIHIRKMTLFKHRYRAASTQLAKHKPRSWSVCLSLDAALAPTQLALEALFGEPVQMR